jgi:hypothetical protein
VAAGLGFVFVFAMALRRLCLLFVALFLLAELGQVQLRVAAPEAEVAVFFTFF